MNNIQLDQLSCALNLSMNEAITQHTSNTFNMSKRSKAPSTQIQIYRKRINVDQT